MNLRHVASIAFPAFAGRSVNMMPFVMGDASSVPEELRDYLPLIDACDVSDSEIGKVGYLTIDERYIDETGAHRRPGIHTEGFGNEGWGGGNWGRGRVGWGGGNWGGQEGGLYMANSIDESCILYDTAVVDTSFGGAVTDEQVAGAASVLMPKDALFWIHDRTPHASLPVARTNRQFFRLVTSDVSLWFAKHSTPNRLGVLPNARIVEQDKFELMKAA